MMIIYLATLGPISRLTAPGIMGFIVAVLSRWMLVQAGFFALLFASTLDVLIDFAASKIYSRNTGRDDPPEVIMMNKLVNGLCYHVFRQILIMPIYGMGRRLFYFSCLIFIKYGR